MGPQAHSLALRDKSMAALLGVLSATPGADYGKDAPFDGQSSSDFGMSPFDVSQNIGGTVPMYAHGGFGFGAGFGAANTDGAALAAAAAGSAQGALALAKHKQNMTAARLTLLDPNQHSEINVERYSFSVPSTPFALGGAAAVALAGQTLQPNTKIRPQVVKMNAPTPMFVTLASLFVANVNVFVGGTEDAFTYSAGAQGVMLDTPTLDPANRATVASTYSAFVPPGFVAGFLWTFITTMQGPSTMAGGL